MSFILIILEAVEFVQMVKPLLQPRHLVGVRDIERDTVGVIGVGLANLSLSGQKAWTEFATHGPNS